ncbi:MAG: hypothetical protein MI748_10460 [Opitutales bacterium]|nr:hypothetical protein [Opitutales bacterium]
MEGDSEKVFVEYLRAVCGRGCGTRITVENAYGGSGDVVLEEAINLSPGYSVVVSLYDADRPAKIKKNLKRAHQLGIKRVITKPCIEALFLEILEVGIPSGTENCKKGIRDILGSDTLVEKKTYENWFPIELLDRRKEDIPDLLLIMKLIRREN